MSDTRFTQIQKYQKDKKKEYILIDTLKNQDSNETSTVKEYYDWFVDKLIDGLAFNFGMEETDARKEEKKEQAKKVHDEECNKIIDTLDINSKTLEKDIERANRKWKEIQDNQKYKEYGFVCEGMKEHIKKMVQALNKQRFDAKCDRLVKSLSPNKSSFETDIESLKNDWKKVKDEFKDFNFTRNDVETYIQNMEQELKSQKEQCDNVLNHDGWAKMNEDPSKTPQDRIRQSVGKFENSHDGKKCHNNEAIENELKKLNIEEQELNTKQKNWEKEQETKQMDAFCNTLENKKDYDSETFRNFGEQKIKDNYDCKETTFNFGGYIKKFSCHLSDKDLVKTCNKYEEILDFITKREEYTKKCKELVGTLNPNDQDFDEKITKLQTQWQDIQQEYVKYNFKKCDNVETYIKDMQKELTSQKKECDDALEHEGWAQAKDEGFVPQERMEKRRKDFETKHDGKKCHNDKDITTEIAKLDEEDKKATEAQEIWESEEHVKQKNDICNQLLNPLDKSNAPSEEVENLQKQTIKDVIERIPNINCEQTSFSFGAYEQTFPCHIKEEETVGSCTNYGDILDRLKKREADIEARNKLKEINSSTELQAALKTLDKSDDPDIQKMTRELEEKLKQLEIQEDQKLVDEFANNLQPPTGKEYDDKLTLLEKELKELIQILRHKDKVNTTSFTNKIQEFTRHRDSCNEKIKEIEKEFEKIGKKMPDDMTIDENCKINDIEKRLENVKKLRTAELKEYKDIAEGNVHKSKKDLKDIVDNKKNRIPDEDYKQMQAILDGRDSIFNLIQQQFGLLKGIAEQYEKEREEFEGHNQGQKIEVERVEKLNKELVNKTEEIFKNMREQAKNTQTIDLIA